MKNLTEIKERLIIVVGQISNERLTGDAYTDYKIRLCTSELQGERNRLRLIAWEDFGAQL